MFTSDGVQSNGGEPSGVVVAETREPNGGRKQKEKSRCPRVQPAVLRAIRDKSCRACEERRSFPGGDPACKPRRRPSRCPCRTRHAALCRTCADRGTTERAL